MSDADLDENSAKTSGRGGLVRHWNIYISCRLHLDQVVGERTAMITLLQLGLTLEEVGKLAILAALVRTRSVPRAARELATTPPLIYRRLKHYGLSMDNFTAIVAELTDLTKR